MSNFDLKKYLAEGKLLKEGEYTYTNDTNTEFGPDVLDLDYDKIRAYISTKKGDDFADNFIDGYNDNFYENVVRFFDKIENPTDEEVLNFIDIEIEKYLAEGKLLKEEYNLPDSDSTTDQYVNNHWDGILKDILRAHTDLRNSKGGENIPERPSQLDIDIVLGRFDGAGEFMDVDPNEYNEYFDFYDMYLVTQRDEENTKSISDEDYPKGNYDGYTKRDDLPKLSEGKLLKEESTEVFTDAELDMASEMLMDMYDKLGLEDSVERSDALFKVIEAFFETLD